MTGTPSQRRVIQEINETEIVGQTFYCFRASRGSNTSHFHSQWAAECGCAGKVRDAKNIVPEDRQSDVGEKTAHQARIPRIYAPLGVVVPSVAHPDWTVAL